MIQKNKGLSVRRQCELLKVNCSSLYYETKPEDTAKAALKEGLMQRIHDWHTKCQNLGSRKKKFKLSKRNFKESIVPYLLRNYTVNFPNQVWSIDTTYIPMKKGYMYLTTIID